MASITVIITLEVGSGLYYSLFMSDSVFPLDILMPDCTNLGKHRCLRNHGITNLFYIYIYIYLWVGGIGHYVLHQELAELR